MSCQKFLNAPQHPLNLIEKGNMTNCGCEIEYRERESERERSHDELIKLCKYLRATGAVQHPARSRRAKGVEVDSLDKSIK